MFLLLICLFLTWKLLITIAALIAPFFLPLQLDSIARPLAINAPYLAWIWVNFDGINYLTIARNGYQYPNYAYFPLFPFLSAFAHEVFHTPRTASGLWVSNIAFFVGLVFLYKITLLDFSKKIALRTVVFCLVIPTSFYYGAFYTDGLYFGLSVSSFYAARKSWWLLAGIAGYFAGLARLIGVALFPALLLEWYIQNKQRDKSFRGLVKIFLKEQGFFLFLIPLGIITYGLYLQYNFGDFFLFQKAMKDWGQSQFIFPPQVLFRYLKILFVAQHNFPYFVAMFEFAAALFYCYLMLRMWKTLRSSYILLMFLTFLIPTLTGTWQSMPRYILHMFPAFIAIALITLSSKKLYYGLILFFVILQFFLIACFTRGYFVA